MERSGECRHPAVTHDAALPDSPIGSRSLVHTRAPIADPTVVLLLSVPNPALGGPARRGAAVVADAAVVATATYGYSFQHRIVTWSGGHRGNRH